MGSTPRTGPRSQASWAMAASLRRLRGTTGAGTSFVSCRRTSAMSQKIAVTLLAAAALVAAASAAADDCAHKAAREALLDAGGAREVRIEAGAGELKVEGKPGLTRVEARGTACAPTAGVLDQVRLTATRDGDTVVVKVEMPDGGSELWTASSPRLDLAVLVPPTIALKVNDGSGSMSVTHVGPLQIRDGSGELTVTDVGGDLDVHDG